MIWLKKIDSDELSSLVTHNDELQSTGFVMNLYIDAYH